MTDLDPRLLESLQQRVPLVREPFADIAARLGCDEQTVLERIAELRGPGGTIREISGIFDAAALGYDQALIGFRVPFDRVDDAGALVAAHPGVSHCYGRDNEFDLWFTLAASPKSTLGLDASAARLAERCGADAHLVLPTVRRYKLDTRPALSGRPAAATDPTVYVPQRGAPPKLSDEQIRAIRALQIDLPARSDPFAPLAESAGIDPDTLLVHAADMLAAGWLRRYAAVLYHRSVGVKANVMVVWKVDESAADAAGAAAAALTQVSHCYLRPTSDLWPYGLYTMIHGRDPAECESVVQQIAAATALTERAMLWTTQEYKKKRVRLFSDDEGMWEQQ